MAKRAWKSKTKAKEDIPAGTKMLLSDSSHYNYPVEVVNWSTSFNMYGDATHATVKTERGNLLQVPHFALHEAKRTNAIHSDVDKKDSAHFYGKGYEVGRLYGEHLTGSQKRRAFDRALSGYKIKRFSDADREFLHQQYQDGINDSLDYSENPKRNPDDAYEAGKQFAELCNRNRLRPDREHFLSKFRAWLKGKGKGIPKAEVKYYQDSFESGFKDNYNVASRRNPASAAELSTEFHGREPIDIQNMYMEEIYQSDLAKLGILTELEVIDRTGKYKVPIQFDTDSKSVSLAASPDGKQLYLCGGDQELELDSFDLPKVEKQFVSIGEVLTISYYTDKHHMSKAEAKGSEYIHEFGEEGGDLPTLVYDTLNKRLQLVGGSYEVKPEGITN